MPGNSMSCPVPARALKSLPRLTRIDLSNNRISGRYIALHQTCLICVVHYLLPMLSYEKSNMNDAICWQEWASSCRLQHGRGTTNDNSMRLCKAYERVAA